MAIAYLGLGSNLGNREQNIRDALQRLSGSGVEILKLSSIIETDPVGGPPQGLFLNAVVKVKTALFPLELLRICQSVEVGLGRVRTVINGPRTVDIDILKYDDLELSTPELTIPHPRMWERDFVTRPLREVES
ncbi:MAG: 2-amino-4-hydroxy-6-hydroxymethyldihydropteridine diphosphokinase [Candidatus Omnitrophica bacterium]|nr:2-amino-4-hydroxy-6-hydroxymethyldihydropteridine diphosphokinase [Candidatus Omnitrophota bacterium]